MFMRFIDTLRTYILTSSTQMCDSSTFLSYITEQLFTNITFLIFVLFILIAFIFMICTIVIRKRRMPTNFLGYIVGMVLFYIALNFKILISFFGAHIKNLDSKLYSALEEMTKGSSNSYLASIFISVINLLRNDGGITDCESNKILLNVNALGRMHLNNEKKQKAQVGAFNSTNLDDFDAKNDKIPKINILDTKDEPENTNKNNNLSKDSTDNKNDDANDNDSIKVDSDSTSHTGKVKSSKKNLKLHLKFKPEPDNQENDKNSIEATSEKIHHNTINEKKSKEHQDSTPQPPKTISESKQPLSKNSDHSKASNPNNKQATSPLKKEPNIMLRYKISNSMNDDEFDDRDDQFFKKVINTLDFEFTANNMALSRFKEMNKVLDTTEIEITKLDSEIKKLINMSLPAEKEMKSFNVSMEKYDPLRISLISNLKKILQLRALTEHLNFKPNSERHFNSIFKSSDETDKAFSKTTAKIIDFNENILIQWFLIVEFLFFIIFFYCSLVGADVYIFKLIGTIFLLGNALIGIGLMVYANFYDRDCIFGKAPGCSSIFGKNFTQFAKSTNINLKPLQKAKIDSLRDVFEKLKTKSDYCIDALTNLFEDDYISEFSKHNLLFLNLINKIKFVRDDFKELTHSKIDQKQFFNILESINSRLVQLVVNLKLVDKKFLFEFYTREAIFSNFISQEKENILNSVEKQLEGTSKRANKQKKLDCSRILGKICEQRNALDSLSNIMIIGALAFGVCFIF